MLAGYFAKAEYYFGDHYLKKNNSNPKGFFEDYEVNTINEDILKKSVKNMPEIIRYLFYRDRTFYRARWLASLNTASSIKTDDVINARIKERLEKEPFCYKDPRFSYTLPIWKVLSSNTVFLCIFREPQNTARSILKECRASKPLRKLKMTYDQALEIWFNMYQHITLNYQKAKDQHNWLFVHYNQVLSGERKVEMERLTGAQIDDDFPDQRINRTNENNVNLLKEEHLLLYEQLCRLAQYTHHELV